MDGIINIYKEQGYTSHDVIARLRGILKMRKIGHTGTLDPEATGVLPVCIGNATKLCEILTDHDKVYEAKMLLGTVTDTQDITGEVISKADAKVIENISPADIEDAVKAFTGDGGCYAQIPPMYSAIKVNGQKLCDLARKGIVVERKPRVVEIYAIDVLSVELPYVFLRVHCSKGTYIRTLLHDIGKKLGCGACMAALVRSRVAGFALKDSLTLKQVELLQGEGKLDEHICTIEEFFRELAAYRMLPEWERYLLNGNEVKEWMMQRLRDGSETKVLLYDAQNHMKGLYEFSEEKKCYCPVKMFLG